MLTLRCHRRHLFSLEVGCRWFLVSIFTHRLINHGNGSEAALTTFCFRCSDVLRITGMRRPLYARTSPNRTSSRHGHAGSSWWPALNPSNKFSPTCPLIASHPLKFLSYSLLGFPPYSAVSTDSTLDIPASKYSFKGRPLCHSSSIRRLGDKAIHGMEANRKFCDCVVIRPAFEGRVWMVWNWCGRRLGGQEM